MRTTRTIGALAAATALTLGASGALTVPTAAGAATSPRVAAYAGSAQPCTVADLSVKKGRLEGAAGSRFLRVRVTNESGQPCATPGWTRYRFARNGEAIGFRSGPNPGEGGNPAPVVIGAGDTVRSVLSWVDPGPVPARQCHARQATAVRVRLSGLPGFYRLPLKARVCTTWKYRPHGTRLGDG